MTVKADPTGWKHWKSLVTPESGLADAGSGGGTSDRSVQHEVNNRAGAAGVSRAHCRPWPCSSHPSSARHAPRLAGLAPRGRAVKAGPPGLARGEDFLLLLTGRARLVCRVRAGSEQGQQGGGRERDGSALGVRGRYRPADACGVITPRAPPPQPAPGPGGPGRGGRSD